MEELKDIKLTRKQQNEVLDGVVNQLDAHERLELLQKVFDTMTTAQKRTIFEHCIENYYTDTIISLEENGIIESE